MAELEGEDLCACPFCGGRVGCTYGPNKKPNGVTHGMPMCAKFVAMEPDDFMKACREWLEKHQPS